jgi:hypothetical protein
MSSREARRVSGEAKLHPVKTRMRNNHARQVPAQNGTKRKSPAALPGFFDECVFRSVHFASLAI